MSIADSTEARDVVYGVFRTAWEASSYDDVPVNYPDKGTFMPPADNAAWVRVVVILTDSRQRSVGGEAGNRNYRCWGFVCVEIFTPRGDGQYESDLMAKVVKDAYRNPGVAADGIQFRNVRHVDPGETAQGDRAYWKTHVYADFDYFERG